MAAIAGLAMRAGRNSAASWHAVTFRIKRLDTANDGSFIGSPNGHIIIAGEAGRSDRGSRNLNQRSSQKSIETPPLPLNGAATKRRSICLKMVFHLQHSCDKNCH